jgi:hypothetical protein
MREDTKILLRKLKEIGKTTRKYEYLELHRLITITLKKFEDIELSLLQSITINSVFEAVNYIINMTIIDMNLIPTT